jgi:hypothetical protein
MILLFVANNFDCWEKVYEIPMRASDSYFHHFVFFESVVRLSCSVFSGRLFQSESIVFLCESEIHTNSVQNDLQKFAVRVPFSICDFLKREKLFVVSVVYSHLIIVQSSYDRQHSMFQRMYY